MAIKNAQTQSPSSSPPPPLPDLQLVMTFIINGKQLELQKQATIQIQCRYEDFMANISTLCRPKLPRGKGLLSEGVKVVFGRAWITSNEFKAHRKKKQIVMASFDDESDFLALQNEVTATRNPRECYLMMNVHITFDVAPISATQQLVDTTVATLSTGAVPPSSLRTVYFLPHYLIVDCYNPTKGCTSIVNNYST
jgi:hypothetical protein